MGFFLAGVRQRVDEPQPVRLARAEYVAILSSRHDFGRGFGAFELHPQSIASTRDAGPNFTFAYREADSIAARVNAHRVFAATRLEAECERVLAAVGPPGVEPMPRRPWVGGCARTRRGLFAQPQELPQRGEREHALGRRRRRRKK